MAIYIVRSAVGKARHRSGTEFLATAWKAIDTTSYGDSGAAILADPDLVVLGPIVDNLDANLSDAKFVLNAGIIHASTLVRAEVPAGAINGSNTAFTVVHAPAPASSLELYKSTDGGATWTFLTLTTDYTLVGAALTMVTAPAALTLLLARYRF